MSAFAHDTSLGTTTLSELERVRTALAADTFFGCFAYATQSGFRAFELGIGPAFWEDTASRWLFGIDYGRTDPRALRAIAEQDNTEVRIFDGQFVVNRPGFVPRRDYHPKLSMMGNSGSRAEALVVGSGNFSYNGLCRSVEAGSATIATSNSSRREHVEPVRSVFESLWRDASPLHLVIDRYETRLAELFDARDAGRSLIGAGSGTGFWIEAGYVTKNRGDEKPGNQIFAPSGFGAFFGFGKAKVGSTLIGEIVFETEIGSQVAKNYRANRNGMEKLTLPTPEDHGFGVYDGKVLLFQRRHKMFLLTTVERDDFEPIYGHRLANVRKMDGGRRFGELI